MISIGGLFRRSISIFKTYRPGLPLPSLAPEQQVLIVETFAEKLIGLDALRTDYRFVHLSPQVWYLQLDGVRVPDNIVPMDDSGAFIARGVANLGLSLLSVPHVNRSRCDLTHVLTSAKIRGFVWEFYAADFAFFAADPALAQLAGREPSPFGPLDQQTPVVETAARSGVPMDLPLNGNQF